MATRRSAPARSRGPQVRGALTRERILDAALELVARRGPRAVTYRAVAERAGVAQGVMTYHFGSRRELLSEAFQLHLERLRGAARELPIASVQGLSSDAKSRLVFGFLKEMAQTHRLRFLAEFELTLELARDASLRAAVEPHTDLTRSFAQELLAASGSPAPREDAILVSAVMDGLTLAWLTRPGDRKFERELRASVRRLVELFFE
jgi:AcrR family transcriptional regulator